MNRQGGGDYGFVASVARSGTVEKHVGAIALALTVAGPVRTQHRLVLAILKEKYSYS